MRHKAKIKNILARVPATGHVFKNWEPSENVAARFNPAIRAKEGSDETTLNILSEIGEYFDWFTGETSGVGAKTVSAFLKKADGRDITVNINSPGGDYFEGLAIFNMLEQYEGSVHVRILGLAASAASIVAMAGTRIDIAKAGFLMIHNAWTIAMGNKNDMRECADVLEQLDEVMAGVYVDRTGMAAKEISDLLDAETWISGEDAVEEGFADGFLSKDDTVEEPDESVETRAVKRLEKALARAGLTRQERQDLKADFLRDATKAAARKTATPNAGKESPTPTAGKNEDFWKAFKGLTDSLKPATA